jgi:hypothetical protein
MGRPFENQFYPAATPLELRMQTTTRPTEADLELQNIGWAIQDTQFKQRYEEQRDKLTQAGKALRLVNALRPDQMAIRSMAGAASLAANAPRWLDDSTHTKTMNAKSAVNDLYHNLQNTVESGLSIEGKVGARRFLPSLPPFNFGAKGAPLDSRYKNALNAQRIKNALESLMKPRASDVPDFDPNEDPFK